MIWYDCASKVRQEEFAIPFDFLHDDMNNPPVAGMYMDSGLMKWLPKDPDTFEKEHGV